MDVTNLSEMGELNDYGRFYHSPVLLGSGGPDRRGVRRPARRFTNILHKPYLAVTQAGAGVGRLGTYLSPWRGALPAPEDARAPRAKGDGLVATADRRWAAHLLRRAGF